MRKFLFLLLFVFLSDLISIPRFALMRGNQCRDCHINPTGGLIRNKDGWNYGKNNLKLFKSSQSQISPFLNDNISIGLDFRFQYLYSQELRRTYFHKMAGGLYLNFSLSDDINLIATYDLYRGYFEGYGILNLLPLDGYVKVGSFSPNFGIRIDDHTAYSRNGDAGTLSSSSYEGLIFSPGYSQTGIELGIYPTEFLFINFSAGQNKFPFETDPSYLGRFELTPSIGELNFMLGGSYGIFRKLQNSFQLNDFFAGIGFNNFSLMSEIVQAKNYFNQDVKSLIYMLEISYRLMKGLDFVTRYDRIVPDIKVKGIYYSHFIFGFDFYPYSFLEIKPQYRMNLENPKVEKNNSFVLQFHFWY